MKRPIDPQRPGFLPFVPPRRAKAGVHLGNVPRVTGGMARAACAKARTAGIALPALLKDANLTIQQINDTHVPLAARAQVSLLNSLAEAMEDDLLGFNLAQKVELREMGLLYYVLASSQNLLEALQRAARYSSLVNEGVVQHCRVGMHIEIPLEYVGISRHLDRHQAECRMTLLLRILRQLSGKRITAQRVRFVHSRALRPRELLAFFGSGLEFGSDVDQLTLAKSIGNIAVVGADRYLNSLLVRYCEEALAHRRRGPVSFRTRVENAIVPMLPHAEFQARDVARQLGFSQRTLARRLAAEGVSFSVLMDELRLDLANRYLADDGSSISQIAWLLGYRQVSAFSKAYRRWTGSSPRAMRNVGRSRKQRSVVH